MAEIEIAALIVDAAALALNIGEVTKKAVPEPTDGLKSKTRWLQCTLKNETQFQILLDDSYLDSGRYYTAPGSVPPFGQMVFSCCNGDNSVFTGVSGGTAFRVALDHNVAYPFAIGWTNPYAGAIKAAVVSSNTAKDGYDAARDQGNHVDSADSYVGKDKDGKQAKIRFHLSAAPGQEAMFVVTEVKLD